MNTLSQDNRCYVRDANPALLKYESDVRATRTHSVLRHFYIQLWSYNKSILKEAGLNHSTMRSVPGQLPASAAVGNGMMSP
jgi:hypothetical protein